MESSSSLTNDEIKHRILNVYAKFVSDVEPDRLSDHLVQGAVISIDQWQRISRKNLTSSDKCRALLNHLFSTQHPEAFIIVRQVLSEQNHYLLKYIDNQESECGFRVQQNAETTSQDKRKTEQPEKDNNDQKRALEADKERLLKIQEEHEDQKRAWDADKDRLLKIQEEHEDQKRAWEADKERLLKIQEEHEDQKKAWEADKELLLKIQEEHEDQKKAWEAEKDRLLKMQKDHEDQKRAWEADKDRLLKIQEEHEDQKKAWEEEKDRILKTQKEHKDLKKIWEADKARLLKMQKEHKDQKKALEADKDRLLKTQKEHEDQKKTWEADKGRLLKTQKEQKDQKRAWEAEKDRLLKTQKQHETKHNLEEGDLKPKKTSERSPIAEQGNEIDLLRKGNRKLKQELEATKSDKQLLRYESDPELVRMIRTKAAEEGKKAIYGLTILDKELFALSIESSEVEVYDSIEFNFSRRWSLKEIIDPWDIGSCNINKCLYIQNNKNGNHSTEILRVDPSGKLIRKWSTLEGYGRLSVTSESNVILAVFENHKLKEYSPDGRLIREICLCLYGIRYPNHAMKLTNGHFIVSHGYFEADLHRVCVVDADGKLQKSFGGKCGSIMGQMDFPIYLSVDGSEFVMVVDRGNCRVLLLDSNLEFQREILSEVKHELRHPFRILLDESSGRVLLADNGWDSDKEIFTDGRILIFDFK